MKKILILSSLIFLGFLSNYVVAAEVMDSDATATTAMVKAKKHHHCTTDADCHGKKVCVDGKCEKEKGPGKKRA